ncbi:MAG: formate/nitrite transporter family protein, partial [Acidimicrobiia bacterium]
GFITTGALFSVLLSVGFESPGAVALVTGFGFSTGFFFVVLSEAALFTEANVVMPATLLAGTTRARRVIRFWVLSGVLANWLVGMAAFFATMGRTIIGKYIPVFLAVTMFVAAGFQHSPANMGYFAISIAGGGGPGWSDALAWNVIPAGIGNMIGGTLLVAVPFWWIFKHSRDA